MILEISFVFSVEFLRFNMWMNWNVSCHFVFDFICHHSFSSSLNSSEKMWLCTLCHGSAYLQQNIQGSFFGKYIRDSDRQQHRMVTSLSMMWNEGPNLLFSLLLGISWECQPSTYVTIKLGQFSKFHNYYVQSSTSLKMTSSCSWESFVWWCVNNYHKKMFSVSEIQELHMRQPIGLISQSVE